MSYFLYVGIKPNPTIRVLLLIICALPVNRSLLSSIQLESANPHFLELNTVIQDIKIGKILP